MSEMHVEQKDMHFLISRYRIDEWLRKKNIYN